MTTPAVYLDHLHAVSDRDADAITRVWDADGVVEFPYAASVGSADRLDGRPAIVTYFIELDLFGPFTFSEQHSWSTGEREWLTELHGSSRLIATGAPYEQDYIVRFRLTQAGTLGWMREYWDPTR